MKINVFRLLGNRNHTGGAEQSAILHAQVMSELGHKVTLYSNFEGDRKYVKQIRMPQSKLLRWTWSWLYFPLLAALKRPDVLNPHSREDQITLSLTKWLHRTPVVWKDPGDLVHNIKLGREGLLGRINQRLLITAINKADAIYMLNSQDRKTILDRLQQLGQQISSDKFVVIPSDILFDDYNLEAKAPKDTGKFVIGTISRVDSHKGIQYLIAAAKELRKEHDNLELWIVGDGPHRQKLEELSKGLDITFWGHQADVSPFLARIDVFVQPAEFEGWGRNIKEAKYFGKPIIGSNIGGIAQQIEDGKTGLLFEPKDVKQLTGQLERLIKDKSLRDKLARTAKKHALAESDFRNLIKDRVLPLFKSVLDKS